REMDVSSLLSDEPIAELDEKEASMAHDPDKDSELPLDNLDELSLDESAPVETAPVEDQGLDLAVDDSVSLDLGNDEPAESLHVSSDLDLGDGDDLVLQEDAPEAFAVEEEMDLGEV